MTLNERDRSGERLDVSKRAMIQIGTVLLLKTKDMYPVYQRRCPRTQKSRLYLRFFHLIIFL